MDNNLIALSILIAGLIAALVTWRFYRYLSSKALKTESKVDDILVLAFGKPLIIAIIGGAVYLAFTVLILPTNYSWLKDSKYLITLFIILGAWAFSIFVYNVIELYSQIAATKKDNEWDIRVIGLLKGSGHYVIWALAFLLIISYLGIDITPMIAGAGIAGLAVALAAKDILSNFFGGALLLVDKPFKVGDRIKIDGYLGDVVQIGPRTTRIKTLDYQIITLPNSMIANTILTNYNMPDIKLKIKIPVSVAYGTDVKLVKEILLDIAQEASRENEYILAYPAPSVYFLEFGDSSLNFTMILWAKKFNKLWDVKDYINYRIDERFNKEGIEIPFPQMDVHLNK